MPQVPLLYPDFRRRLFSLSYSAHRVMKASELMVFSDSLTIPTEIDLSHAKIEREMQKAMTEEEVA